MLVRVMGTATVTASVKAKCMSTAKMMAMVAMTATAMATVTAKANSTAKGTVMTAVVTAMAMAGATSVDDGSDCG